MKKYTVEKTSILSGGSMKLLILKPTVSRQAIAAFEKQYVFADGHYRAAQKD